MVCTSYVDLTNWVISVERRESDILLACFILSEYIRLNASCTDYTYKLLHIFMLCEPFQ